MFALKKILNSGTNVAEPVRIPTTAGVAYRAGSALVLTDGAVTNGTTQTMPDYIAAQSAAADEKKSILCYPISSNMIFEVPATTGAANLKIGSKVNLVGSTGFIVKIGNVAEGGVATVVDPQGAKKSGDKVLVAFNK